jgi:hypothetical protein
MYLGEDNANEAKNVPVNKDEFGGMLNDNAIYCIYWFLCIFLDDDDN